MTGKHFNVVFQWNEIEYKLLNVYHIEYYKQFAYLVEHALYQASISIANKHRLERIYDELMSLESFEDVDEDERSSLADRRRLAFRKSMREMHLEVIDFSTEFYKYWKHIEIRISNEIYHGEEVFWKTMDLVNRMQALRVYCLL